MLTRKDFVALADDLAIDHKMGELTPSVLDTIVRHCQRSNPNFDKARFLAAVGDVGNV